MRTIPQRELRNNVSRVLREVEAGESLRVTVDGRPVADLVPIEDTRRRFVSREVVEEILRTASADPGLTVDLEEALGDTIDRL
jgi:prevent-host-death family protein